MRRTALVLIVAALSVAVVVGASPASGLVPARQTTLTGAAEVPDSGDPNGRGQFTWSIDGTRLCYLLTVRRIATSAAAHIHRGRVGVAGPVRVELVAPAPRSSAACVDVSAALAQRLRENPRRFYVNVHNAAYPGGAIRGQLRA